MVQVQKLTPEALLSAPRRSAAVPNRTGTHALYTLSTHTWGDKTLKEIRVMDLSSTQSIQISDDEKASEPNWIPGTDDEIIYFKGADKGKTEIYVTTLTDKDHHKVAEINAPISNLKLKKLDGGDIALAVAGMVGPSGELFNDQDESKKPKSSARVYDTANVRVWDKYRSNYRISIWYTALTKGDDGKYSLCSEFHNAIRTKHLESPPVEDIDDAKNYFDISHKGITFLARDILKERDVDTCLASFPYFVPLDTYTVPPSRKPSKIAVSGKFISRKRGATLGTRIRFSPDAANIAFTYANVRDTYTNRIFLTSVESLHAFDIQEHVTNAEFEEHDPPNAFEFAGSSDSLLLLSDKVGRTVISHLKLADGEQPKILYGEGTISAFHPLKEGNYDELLLSSSSFLDSSLWQIYSRTVGEVTRVVSSATKHGAKYGLSRNQVQEIWFEGADDVCNQSFILYPSTFDEKKKYPWIFLPHGGPVSSWPDAWSTRWNMLALAEQGYVVIAPNITGSTGFGTEFAARIEQQWGGRPFKDLLNLIDYLEKLPYLDLDKAVFAGASYSGYLGSWFLGHEVMKKFCCAIWHDGIFSVPGMWYTSDYAVDDGEFGERPYIWDNSEALEKWNPATPSRLANWKHAPPTLVIHSDKDYRCPITEGLAAFRTLQAFGVPSRFLTFEDEGHWVLKPENSLVWHKTVLDWMSRCVNGELKRGDRKW